MTFALCAAAVATTLALAWLGAALGYDGPWDGER